MTAAGRKKLKTYVNSDTITLTKKGEKVFGSKVKTSAYLKNVKDNKTNMSKKTYKEYSDMVRKMDSVESKKLSKKGKIFVDEILKNVDLNKYGVLMSLNEINEDYWNDYDK